MPRKSPKRATAVTTASSAEIIRDAADRAFAELRKEVGNDPKKARDVLFEAGLYTASGRVAKRYRR